MRRAGFTLVELMLVLAILAMMVAFVAPTMAKSSRRRVLEGEALRFVALTEHARDEAVSRGVAFAVYVDTGRQAYGIEPSTENSGVDYHKEFTAHGDLHFEPLENAGSLKNGRVATLTPEGTLDLSGVQQFVLGDRTGDTIRIARQSSGWGYEIAKEEMK